MKYFIAIAALLCFVSGENVRLAFRRAMAKYAKRDGLALSESEEIRKARFLSFAEFHARVEEINADETRPFTAEDNFFSILVPEERQQRLGHNTTVFSDGESEVMLDSDNAIPKSRDFGTHISNIKNQGDCGSCWTFGATAGLEGEIYFTTGSRKVSLSEQEYMECSVKYDACQGGFSKTAYKYSRVKDRIAPTSAYPYREKDSRNCKASGKENALKTHNVKVIGGISAPRTNKGLLQMASSHIVAVAVYVNNDFQAYNKGIYTDENCQRRPNHEVAVVGYGEKSGKKYWKVRNSWGADWGQKGYIFMDRDFENLCRLASDAHIPKLACRNGGCNAVDPNDADTSGDDDSDDFDDESHVCEKNLFLSNCLKSPEAAQKICDESNIAATGCIIVKNSPTCYLGLSDTRVGKSKRTIKVFSPCDGSEDNSDGGSGCNTAGGMVMCSDCNCCKHEHFCHDPL